MAAGIIVRVSSDFPSLKARRLLSILEGLGFETVRRRGSHRIMANGDRRLVFAFHDKHTIKGGLVKKVLMRDAGLTEEEAKALVSGGSKRG